MRRNRIFVGASVVSRCVFERQRMCHPDNRWEFEHGIAKFQCEIISLSRPDIEHAMANASF